MLPAIFAVLFLGHFVAGDIYVGQNPQNVNAVINDNGKLIPVTGVADEIVVVDLNYGGEGNSSGMSVDVSVSPINGTSNGSSANPSSPPTTWGQVPNPLTSSSLPGSISLPFSNPPTSAPGTTNPWGTGSSPGANPIEGIASPAPALSSSPVSDYDNLVTSGKNTSPPATPGAASTNKHQKQFSPFSFPGSFSNIFKKKPTEQKNSPFSFIELGGSLGQVSNISNSSIGSVPLTMSMPGSTNLTSLNISNPMNFSNALPFHGNGFPNFGHPFFNVNKKPMNFTSPFLPISTNSSSLTSLLNSLFNGSTVNLQPLNAGSTPLTGMFNSFINGGSSLFNPGASDMQSITDLVSSFFNNTSSVFNMTGSTVPPLPKGWSSDISSLVKLFSSDLMDKNSPVNSVLDPLMNLISTSGGNTSSMSNLMNSFFGKNNSLFNSTTPSLFGNSTALNNFVNSLFPSEDLGSDDELYDDLGSIASDDDEDYYNPLSNLLPPLKSSKTANSLIDEDIPSNLTDVLGGISTMVNDMLTPDTSGKTPLTELIDSIFTVNGSSPLSANSILSKDLMNFTNALNGSQNYNLNSIMKNFTPMSAAVSILTSLNDTGLFGDLSSLVSVTQNLASILTQGMSNRTNIMNNFGQIMSDMQNMWKTYNSAFQTFLKNVTSKSNTKKNYHSQPMIPASPFSQMKPVPASVGTSFLALPPSSPAPTPNVDSISIPTLLDDSMMQNSAPAAETVPPSDESTVSTPSPSSTSTTPQPSPNSSTGPGAQIPPSNTNGTKTSPSSSGISVSSTWITLVGCLFVAFSQKNFLGLI